MSGPIATNGDVEFLVFLLNFPGSSESSCLGVVLHRVDNDLFDLGLESFFANSVLGDLDEGAADCGKDVVCLGEVLEDCNRCVELFFSGPVDLALFEYES